ncbi:uncharacterized protein TRAVEDRAFT_75248, partial [Trametes versicolor FP-101664 SS1]|uniref:uncharacterized protein n=1 Tax=Trametes versicolor (strain FP-101664) TaxID=717944 RepID=UPI0004623058
ARDCHRHRLHLYGRLQHRAVNPIPAPLPEPRLSPTFLSSSLPLLIALLVDRCLPELQAAAAAHVHLSGDGTASPGFDASSGSPSLLEFVRADVDSWI